MSIAVWSGAKGSACVSLSYCFQEMGMVAHLPEQLKGKWQILPSADENMESQENSLMLLAGG